MLVLKYMVDKIGLSKHEHQAKWRGAVHTGIRYDILGLYKCSHRLFADTACRPPRPFSIDDVADAFDAEQEKEFIYQLRKTLTEMGYAWVPAGGWEGPGIAYCEPKNLYLYRTSSWTGRLVVCLRIRNAEK